MRHLPLAILVPIILVTVVAGCSPHATAPKPAPHADRTNAAPQLPPAWPAIDAGRYRVQFANLGSLKNTGQQLPVASPDGRYVAALSCANPMSLDPDATLNGRTMLDVTLLVYDTAAPQRPPRTVATGAAWPVWTGDSKRLIAVVYEREGRCALVVYDVATSQTRRLHVGLNHIATPALAPDGRRLALAGYAEAPQDARLYVYDLDAQQLTPLSPPKNVVWQVVPMWVNDRALLYYGRVGENVGLLGATIASSPATTKPDAFLAKLHLPKSADDTIRSQAGLHRPLNDAARWLATYDTDANRIVVHDLEQSRDWPLAANSQSGVWVRSMLDASSNARFVFATDKQLFVTSLPGNDSHMLNPQPLLPLWCHPAGHTFLLLAPGREEWTFELLRMTVSG